MTDDNGTPEPTGPSVSLILGVLIVVGLAVAGVVAIVMPSGDEGQSTDQGTTVDIPSPGAAFQGVPLVEVSAVATIGSTSEGTALTCTFTADGAPSDRSTIYHVTVNGKGAVPVPLLHPSEQAMGSTAQSSDLPFDQVRVIQPLPKASGPYTCELVAVMTAYGPAELTGQTTATAAA
jgi:hypothetical protein